MEYCSKCQCLVGCCCLQRGQRVGERMEREEGKVEEIEREGKGADPWYSHSPTKTKLHLAKTPRRVKITYVERETVKSKQALGPLTVLQKAPVSFILHAEACLKLLLLISAWAAWLCCPGPSGSPVSPTHKHSYSNANPSATMTLSFALSQALVFKDNSLYFHNGLWTRKLTIDIYF